MELSLWANHPKDHKPSLFSRDQPYDKPISMRGDELPLLTVKQSFWAFLMGLRPPCLYPLTRNIILKGYPMSLSEANSFQFTQGEPTHGLAGLYSVNNIVFLPSLSTDYVL